jgi:microcystin-dependent protein
MADPYIGEIRMFAGNFAPLGWMFCDGSVLSISQYEVLFNLIGTTYGGDGQNTFKLPDLRGRSPVHVGTGHGQTYVVGQSGGIETVTLSQTQIPSHVHSVMTTSAGTTNTPGGSLLLSDQNGGQGSIPAYAAPNASTLVALAPQSIAPAGGDQPHDNMQPFLALNFIIAFEGIYPSQS